MAYTNLSVVSVSEVCCGNQSEKLAFGSYPSRIQALMSYLQSRHKKRMHVFVVLFILALPYYSSWGSHHSWHDHYTSAAGTRCCDRDCVRAAGRLMNQTDAGMTLEINGVLVTVPAKSVHPSEDGAFWVCLVGIAEATAQLRSEQVRCAFFAIGG